MLRLSLFIFAACAGMAFAQTPPAAPAPRVPIMKAPTNLKVLTPENYEDVMFGMQSSLGVRCDFCHSLADYASDEKRAKGTARQMMQMVSDINTNSFRGQQRVSCYTCHHGENRPAQMPGNAVGGGGRGAGGFSGGRGGGAAGPPAPGPGR